MRISIQPVTTIAECHQIEEIIRLAWGGDDIVIPFHLLITIAKQSGCVLLAREGDLAVGFCFGFTAFTGRDAADPALRLKHHSHQAGVIPSHQGRGIGSMLKWAQRDFVLQQRIEQMTWTFDPLELANARLNIHKLGAVCQTYKRDVYGSLADPLNMGVETDRFMVDWWLDSVHVEQHKAGTFRHNLIENLFANGIPIINTIEWRDSAETPLAHPVAANLNLLKTEDKLLLTIPNNFQTIKKLDLTLAQKWRQHTRHLFEPAFAANFIVTDAFRTASQGYYLLERGGEVAKLRSCGVAEWS